MFVTRLASPIEPARCDGSHAVPHSHLNTFLPFSAHFAQGTTPDALPSPLPGGGRRLWAASTIYLFLAHPAWIWGIRIQRCLIRHPPRDDLTGSCPLKRSGRAPPPVRSDTAPSAPPRPTTRPPRQHGRHQSRYDHLRPAPGRADECVAVQPLSRRLRLTTPCSTAQTSRPPLPAARPSSANARRRRGSVEEGPPG